MPEDYQIDKLFRSAEELEEPEIAYVNGKIPDWLNGTYLKIGPGKFDLSEEFSMTHWLDGYSIISRFNIQGDRIEFSKKFLQSEAYKRALVAKKPVFCEYGTRAYPDPQKGFFSKLTARLLPIELTDNDTLSLFKLGHELFASSETNYFRQVDPCSLNSGDRYDTNKYFGLNVCSAHPLTDVESGITYQLGSTLLTGCKYHFVKIPPVEKVGNGNGGAKACLKKAKTLCTIDSSYFGGLSFNHSFGMSRKYLIFVEQPYVMNVTRAISSCIKGTQTFRDWLEWRGDNDGTCTNRFFIVDKETGKVMKTEIIAEVPFFFLHVINAYEENGHLVVDINSYPNISILDNMTLSKIRGGDLEIEDHPCPIRFVIPLVESLSGVVEEENLLGDFKTEAIAYRIGNQLILKPEQLAEKGFELPMINKNFMCKKYTYIYATGSVAPGYYQSAIGKIDIKKKEVLFWRESSMHYPGEPMFVPNPNSNNNNSNSEDDGVLISCVTDTTHKDSRDFIIFLDARTMKELGRARFNNHIPQGLHGLFIENQAK